MRKIEKLIKKYFDAYNKNVCLYKTYKLSIRDKIEIHSEGINLLLWDSLILWQSRNEKDIFYFSLRGWQTNTTLLRLKIFIPIYQKNYGVFVNNQKIDICKIYEYNQLTEELKEV